MFTTYANSVQLAHMPCPAYNTGYEIFIYKPDIRVLNPVEARRLNHSFQEY